MMARMMARFPVNVTRYMDRNSLEEERLQVWVLCESQEEKVSDLFGFLFP